MFSRRDNLRRHLRSNSHPRPSKPAGAIDNSDHLEGLRQIKKGYTGPVGEPAYDYDQEHQSRSGAGSHVTTNRLTTGSHVTLAIRSKPKRSSRKRTRKSLSDDEEDSSGDGPSHKKPRESVKPGLILLCPVISCSAKREGPISVLTKHIKEAHLKTICIHCLSQTSVHQERGCQKICASPDCPYKTGDYHFSTDDCVDQRSRDEVTIIKYGLVCEALGLAKKPFVSSSEQRCHDCQTNVEIFAIMNMDSQKKEGTIARQGETIARQGETIARQGETIAKQGETIARLNAVIETPTDNMSKSFDPSQTIPSQSDIVEPPNITSGAYAQPILPWASQFDFLVQEIPQPTSAPPQFHFTAPSSSAHQDTQPGSFTQPSFPATNSTYISQRETGTETSEAIHDTDADLSTPKPFEMGDFVRDDYDPSLFDDESALYEAGGQFNDLLGKGASFIRVRHLSAALIFFRLIAVGSDWAMQRRLSRGFVTAWSA